MTRFMTCLLWLTGCVEPLIVPGELNPTDQWTATRAVCDWDAHRASAAWVEDVGGWGWPDDVPLYPSEACMRAVMADLRVDVEAFAALEGPANPGRGTRLGSLLLAARTLFVDDYGPVDALEPGPLISEAFARTMAQVALTTGVEDLGAAQYNFITSVVRRTVPSDCTDAVARFDADTGTVRLCVWYGAGWGGGFGAGVLVHEAGHHLWGKHLPCHGTEAMSCDGDLEGTHGAFLASQLALLRATPPWAVSAGLIEADVRAYMRFINAFTDPLTGELDPAWRDVDLRRL